MAEENVGFVSGKRKTAVAKVRIREGSGKVSYNKIPYEKLPMLHRLAISEPIRIYESVAGKVGFDASITATGGGKEGQIQAARLGLAKAILQFTRNADVKKAYVAYDRHLLVADVRRKEAYKPGDSKARSKRQKSYR